MIFVSITRLRIRSIRFMPGFALHTSRSISQVRNADGFVGGSLLADRKRTFWTMTRWRDQQAMRRYITTGPHLKVMPKLLDWCDEASVVHWTQDSETAPSWTEADQRMRTQGRPSKVRHPSPRHQDMTFDAPRTTGAVPIRPEALRSTR